jgi:hypothetical protein
MLSAVNLGQPTSGTRPSGPYGSPGRRVIWDAQAIDHVAGFRVRNSLPRAAASGSHPARGRAYLQPTRMASSVRPMTALPAGQEHQDSLDPARILRVLPEGEREAFLAEYRRAVDEARDPAAWKDLQRFLRLWALRAIAVAQPGYYQARAAAQVKTGGGMLLKDAIRQHRAGR